MTVDLTLTRLAGAASARRLLIVGPSLGTSVAALWGEAANLLADTVDVVGWDLPGHGAGAPATAPFTIADLADAVRRRTADLAAGRPVAYAGVSIGGAVGFVLATDPGPFHSVAAIASAPRIGEPAAWHERAALVRRAGTSVLVEASAVRWFAPRFVERRPATADVLLTSLADADRFSYAWACEALAGFDARAAVTATTVPVLIAPGEHDQVVTPAYAEQAARSIPGAVFRVIKGCGHQPPAEDPAAVDQLLTDFLVAEEARR